MAGAAGGGRRWAGEGLGWGLPNGPVPLLGALGGGPPAATGRRWEGEEVSPVCVTLKELQGAQVKLSNRE